MKEQGRSGADMAAKIVAFNSDMAAARTLGAASARIDLGAQELQVALPQALELSRKVYRPDFKPIGEIQQAIQGKTSDPDLLEFRSKIKPSSTPMRPPCPVVAYPPWPRRNGHRPSCRRRPGRKHTSGSLTG